MHTRAEVRTVLRLATAGLARNEIARRAGIPRSTVGRWLSDGEPGIRAPAIEGLDAVAYCHLLGLYLGDGHVAEFPRTYCLRVYLDRRYPRIVDGCVAAMRRVAPRNRVAVHDKPGCRIVQCYSNAWPDLLPQHGPGPKHARPITLVPWQAALARAHPQELIRGLLESDGSRHVNAIHRGERTYAYPRYSFSNRSEDIKAIFCEHLDLLGIAWRCAGDANISLARREAVAALDEFVGPKR